MEKRERSYTVGGNVNLYSYYGEGVEKREPSYTVGGNVNWYSYYGEQYSSI